jgi:hypothetical protein
MRMGSDRFNLSSSSSSQPPPNASSSRAAEAEAGAGGLRCDDTAGRASCDEYSASALERAHSCSPPSRSCEAEAVAVALSPGLRLRGQSRGGGGSNGLGGAGSRSRTAAAAEAVEAEGGSTAWARYGCSTLTLATAARQSSGVLCGAVSWGTGGLGWVLRASMCATAVWSRLVVRRWRWRSVGLMCGCCCGVSWWR